MMTPSVRTNHEKGYSRVTRSSAYSHHVADPPAPAVPQMRWLKLALPGKEQSGQRSRKVLPKLSETLQIVPSISLGM